MQFPERLKALIKERSISLRELAGKIGVAHVTIYKWSKGVTKPTDENIEQLAEFFGVTPAFLKYGEGADSYRQTLEIGSEVISIPVLDVEGSCGSWGSDASQVSLVQMLRVTRRWLRDHSIDSLSFGQLHIITARGDSMEPGIVRGDFLVIDCGQAGPPDDGVYALQYSGSVFVKRVQVLTDGRLNLISDNPLYPPQTVELSEDVRIIGKCVLSFNVRQL